jgi:hypothetical protein
MKDTTEIVNRARYDCEALEGHWDWQAAVEDRIYEIAEDERIADSAIEQLNRAVFSAAGII